MDWVNYSLARQLLVEERIGTRVREVQQAEADEFDRAKSHLPRG